jgi:hypothetical protein
MCCRILSAAQFATTKKPADFSPGVIHLNTLNWSHSLNGVKGNIRFKSRTCDWIGPKRKTPGGLGRARFVSLPEGLQFLPAKVKRHIRLYVVACDKPNAKRPAG